MYLSLRLGVGSTIKAGDKVELIPGIFKKENCTEAIMTYATPELLAPETIEKP
jgi:hypothetical protein